MKPTQQDISTTKNLVSTKNGNMPDKNKTRYVIVDEENGVFLGTYSPARMKMLLNIEDDEVEQSYALFARDNPFTVARSCSFESVSEAQWFIYQNFGSNLELTIEPVKCSSKYPDVVELIKSGLEHATFDMMDGLDYISETVH